MKADVEPSGGWELLSDHGVIEFWEGWREKYEKLGIDPSEVKGFMDTLSTRGMRIDPCPNCHHLRIRQLHDYICIICRKLEE